MPDRLPRLTSKNWRPGHAAAAGLAATAVYSIAMQTDKYFTGNSFNDVKFIQGLLGDHSASSRRACMLAWTLHFLNGALLGELYAAVGKRLLSGPDWLKGTAFGEAFIICIWPLTPLVDRLHPMAKNGQLPRLACWRSFFQNLLRHFVFGLTLGLVYHEPAREKTPEHSAGALKSLSAKVERVFSSCFQ